VPIVLKSGSLNLLEPSGPVEACNGIALLFYLHGGTMAGSSKKYNTPLRFIGVGKLLCTTSERKRKKLEKR
jgi:hypothetical protein